MDLPRRQQPGHRLAQFCFADPLSLGFRHRGNQLRPEVRAVTCGGRIASLLDDLTEAAQKGLIHLGLTRQLVKQQTTGPKWVQYRCEVIPSATVGAFRALMVPWRNSRKPRQRSALPSSVTPPGARFGNSRGFCLSLCLLSWRPAVNRAFPIGTRLYSGRYVP